jgi:hypothetical protein
MLTIQKHISMSFVSVMYECISDKDPSGLVSEILLIREGMTKDLIWIGRYVEQN